MRARKHMRGAARMVPKLTALALVLAVAGCSRMPSLSDLPDVPDLPDWANPVSWVDGLFDGGDDVETLPKAPTVARGTPDSGQPYPKLSSAPAPKPASSSESRRELARSLVADRENARYTEQNLRAGDQRVAAAPPPLKTAPVGQAKPSVPMAAKQSAAVPAARGTAPLPAPPSLPPAPARMAGTQDSSRLTNVSSIVQRRGGLPPPPAPITEVSRGAIPQIVQRPGQTLGEKQVAGLAALPKPPAIMPSAPPMAAAAAPSGTAPLILIPPTTPMPAAMPPSVRVNLPLGPGQSILAQTFAASLAAQNSPVLQQPGNIFNAPNAAPISGQWPTVVPPSVRQAFNASLDGPAQGVRAASAGRFSQASRMPLIASPQMSNAALRRLPGAPVLIRFRHGSTRLSGREKQRLAQIASTAKGGGGTIYVVGHASQRTGDMNYARHKMVNFGVSLDRANRVAGELRRRGVAAEMIVVQAKGDTQPLYFEFMPDGEAKNRRVEIFIR
ncbi:MAG: OmpA family protein [Alphaproteobacteria bacterium]